LRLLEYQAKNLFSQRGVLIPKGRMVSTPQEVAQAAAELGGPVAVKAQVPVGGRGKAGGIALAQTPEEAASKAEGILGLRILGHVVSRVLVEEQIRPDRELYLSVTLDAGSGLPVIMFSPQGGVDVEELALSSPELIHKMEVCPQRGVPEYKIRWFLRAAGNKGKTLMDLTKMARALWDAFSCCDLTLAEINPVGLSPQGGVVAMDAKAEVDDNALFRQKWCLQSGTDAKSPGGPEPEELEARAREIGVTYVGMRGEIGVVASGAGLGMCTMDLIKASGLEPANFLETGGGITRRLMEDAVRLVASAPEVRGIVVNLYGGVNPLVEAAHGVVEAKRRLDQEGRFVPIVVKALGNRQEEAWRLLEEAGLPTVKTVSTEQAIERLLKSLQNSGAERE